MLNNDSYRFYFSAAANAILEATLQHSSFMHTRRIRAHFEVTAEVSAVLGQKLIHGFPTSFQPKHLLFALLFLKCYHTEHIKTKLSVADEKPF